MTSNGTPTDTEQTLAAWLSPRLLVILTSHQLGLADPGEWHVAVEHGEEIRDLDASWCDCSADAASGDGHAGALLMAGAIPSDLEGQELGRLLLRRAEERVPLGNGPLAALLCTPAALGKRCREQFDAAARTHIQTFLAMAPKAHRLDLTPKLAGNLLTIRDAVRDSLPTTKLEPGPCSARLEAVTAISDHSFWLSGWIHHAQPREARLTAISPEGTRAVIPTAAITYRPRPAYSETLQDDATVSTLGFEALIELDAPSRHRTGWIMEFRMADGEAVEDAARHPVETNTSELMDHVRSVLKTEPLDESVLEQQVVPLLSAMRGGRQDAQIDKVIDFGDVITEPEVSVVIAVRRVDRIQHQLAEFVRDPELADAEMIFVAADTGTRLPEVAEELYELYGVPFRLLTLSRTTRRQRALNLGASIARGRLLMLMSGDVLPAGPGWLKALKAFYESSPDIGVVGPKLLREDDSIASAGVEFVLRRASSRWQRNLPLAGLARGLAAANSPRRVQGLLDSCLLVGAADFRASGGFTELYLGENDEGTDLCLRLATAGQETWYCPEAELYLLDRPDSPSKPSPVRDRFNEWLFAKRCAEQLTSTPQPRREQPARPAAFASPAMPAVASGPAEPPIKQLEVIQGSADHGPLLDAGLTLVEPQEGRQPMVFEGTYAFAITGWAIADDPGPVTVCVRGGMHGVPEMAAELPSPELAEKYPDIPDADASGFQFVISVLGLPLEFELEVVAITAVGEEVSLGHIRGRRRAIRSNYRPVLQPVLVTMTGRSGSNWMVSVLGNHPEILAYKPFWWEPQLASYWMAVLRGLGDPASYMQSIQPQLYESDWWTGHGRKALPLYKPGDMAQWLGREHVEALAGFCQSRMDAFYNAVARAEGRSKPRYFTEKCVPGTAGAVTELYPNAREILLVRDFRDRVVSILDYNEKRKHALWGRDKAQNDDEWFQYLRHEALDLLENWRQRKDSSHLVRYEDLVLEPESTLAGILDYLGVDDRPETIRETLARAKDWLPRAQVNHRTAASVEESVGRWKRELSPERQAACAEAFDDILLEFGYEPSGEVVSTTSSPESGS